MFVYIAHICLLVCAAINNHQHTRPTVKKRIKFYIYLYDIHTYV